MLEEDVLLESMKDAIRKGLFNKSFLKELDHELKLTLSK